MMSKKAFDKIMAGLNEAIAYSKGEASGAIEHVVKVPDHVDVRAIRAKLGLSRPKFAARFGLDPRALQDWEQHRRRPDRATRVLMQIIAREPEAVDRALAPDSPTTRSSGSRRKRSPAAT